MAGLLASSGAAVALFASALVPQQAASAPAEAPGEGTRVSIESVNGSGCPQDTTRVSTSSDGKTVTVTYSDYLAWAGEGAEATDFRKNCVLSLDIDAPAGYSFAVEGLEYRGYAHLERGATGLQQAQYYFQGQSGGSTASHEFEGPYSGSLERRDSFPSGDLIWSPCNEQRNLNVNTELRVDAGSSRSDNVSLMAMHSNSVPGTTLHLTWREC